jgi:hypothetical protein
LHIFGLTKDAQFGQVLAYQKLPKTAACASLLKRIHNVKEQEKKFTAG